MNILLNLATTGVLYHWILDGECYQTRVRDPYFSHSPLSKGGITSSCPEAGWTNGAGTAFKDMSGVRVHF